MDDWEIYGGERKDSWYVEGTEKPYVHIDDVPGGLKGLLAKRTLTLVKDFKKKWDANFEGCTGSFCGLQKWWQKKKDVKAFRKELHDKAVTRFEKIRSDLDAGDLKIRTFVLQVTMVSKTSPGKAIPDTKVIFNNEAQFRGAQDVLGDRFKKGGFSRQVDRNPLNGSVTLTVSRSGN